MSAAFAVGDTFAGDFHFTAENIRAMATLLGDTNPIHHTAAPEYGALVACGGHVAGWMMSLGASRITDRAPSLGRTWSIRFRAPVRAGDMLHVVWRVVAVVPHHRGTMITVEGVGTVARDSGTITAVIAEGTAVLLDHSPAPSSDNEVGTGG